MGGRICTFTCVYTYVHLHTYTLCSNEYLYIYLCEQVQIYPWDKLLKAALLIECMSTFLSECGVWWGMGRGKAISYLGC